MVVWFWGVTAGSQASAQRRPIHAARGQRSCSSSSTSYLAARLPGTGARSESGDEHEAQAKYSDTRLLADPRPIPCVYGAHVAAPSAFLTAAFAGVIAGAVMQSQLVHLRYRLPDEINMPKPPAGWVIPVTGALTAVTWWVMVRGHPLIVPIVYVVAVWVMVPLAFVDLDVHRLPNKIQLPAYPILAALLAACSYATGDWGAFVRALIAGAVLWVFFLILALVLLGGGIGFGDVKLAGLLGMLLGWLTWAHVIIATMATFLIGGVIAALLLVTRRKGRKDEFAYGPSMLLGAIVAIVAPLVLRSLT